LGVQPPIESQTAGQTFTSAAVSFRRSVSKTAQMENDASASRECKVYVSQEGEAVRQETAGLEDNTAENNLHLESSGRGCESDVKERTCLEGAKTTGKCEETMHDVDSCQSGSEVEQKEKHEQEVDVCRQGRDDTATSGKDEELQAQPQHGDDACLKPVETDVHMPHPTQTSWEHFSDSDEYDTASECDHEVKMQFSRRCSRPESEQDELDAIQCPICLGYLCEPLRFGCAHAFCRLCVISWAQTACDGRSCPLCRAAIDIEDPFTHEVDKELDSEVRRLLSPEAYQESKDEAIKQLHQLKETKASARLPIILAPRRPVRSTWAGSRVQGEMAELPLFLRSPAIAVQERAELELRSLEHRVMAQRLHSAPQLFVAAHTQPFPPTRGVLVLVERCRPLSRGVGVKLTVRGLEEGTVQMVRTEMAGTVEVPYARVLVRNEEARSVIASFRSYLWAHDTPPGIVDMLGEPRGLLCCLKPDCTIS